MADADKPKGNAYPESAPGEFGYNVARLSLNVGGDVFLPGLGTTAALFVDRFIGNPLEKRRVEFLNGLARGIDDLQQRLDGFDVRTLNENETFISVVAFAADAAQKTHIEERRKAFCNVALNAAVGISLNDVLLGSFLAILDRYTGIHIAMLKIYAAPLADPEILRRCVGDRLAALNMLQIFAIAFPDTEEAVIRRVSNDLHNDWLVEGNIEQMTDPHGISYKKTTEIGDAFISFISEPLGDL